MRIKYINRAHYQVIYDIDLRKKECSCKDFHFNKEKKDYMCKHLKVIYALLSDPKFDIGCFGG